jgi:hypothetical protein
MSRTSYRLAVGPSSFTLNAQSDGQKFFAALSGLFLGRRRGCRVAH